jgi:protocatechuate 3,4-dioxygenase beta subunit
LKDGSYAITDIDGRYHFEGVVPGLHVVQVDPSTFPLDQAPSIARRIRAAPEAPSRALSKVAVAA